MLNVSAKFPAKHAGYIFYILCVTRLCTIAGASFVVYYVHLNTILPGDLLINFIYIAALTVIISTSLSLYIPWLRTHHLRLTLTQLSQKDLSKKSYFKQAGQEASSLAIISFYTDLILGIFICLIPCLIYLTLIHQAPLRLLVHLTIGGLLGIVITVTITYFTLEKLMCPVLETLYLNGIQIRHSLFYKFGVQAKILVYMLLTAVCTLTMIDALVFQRINDILSEHMALQQGFLNLQNNLILISIVSLATSIFISRALAKSLSEPINKMVKAMKEIESGNYEHRLLAISQNELGILEQSFNDMVEKIQLSEKENRQLNLNLENKVIERTYALEFKQKELEMSYEKLKKLDHLKTEFFSNISHELRTPLTLILSPLESLLQSSGVPENMYSYLRTMHISALNLLALINNLLDFSRLESQVEKLNYKRVALDKLIAQLLQLTLPLAEEKQITIHENYSEDLPLMSVDPDKIKKIFLNIISNALKFTPPKGTIEVSVQTQAGGDILVSVSDTGIGIPEAALTTIFERFAQVDSSSTRSYGGTGIGLSLARELVTLHGGTIQAFSPNHSGATIEFTLPARLTQKEPESEYFEFDNSDYIIPSTPILKHYLARMTGPLSEVDSDSEEEKPLILIVEDNQEMREFLASELQRDFRVISACDGQDGWDKVLYYQPQLVLSDVMMPNINGYDLCNLIKQNHDTAHIPLILLTAKTELDMKLEGLKQGADDYLVKPFSLLELKARIVSLLKLRTLNHQMKLKNKELESTLEQLTLTQEKLIFSEKMASIGKLSSGIAHDLNNALNFVVNAVKPLSKSSEQLKVLLQEEGTSIGEKAWKSFLTLERAANVIDDGVSRATKVINGLKYFSHSNQEKKEFIDFNQAIEINLELLASHYKERIELNIELQDLNPLKCVVGQINQMLMNILVNAIQAIEGKGTLTVKTEDLGDKLRVLIQDDGCGISPENMSKLFDPFFTTKGVGNGSGLGLSISYGIVKEHGGTIDVQSVKGEGSIFSIVLPYEHLSLSIDEFKHRNENKIIVK